MKHLIGVMFSAVGLWAISSASAGDVTFTPEIQPLPDLVIGDNTPDLDVPLGGLPTVESLASEEPNTFRFDNAINIFDFVEDQPNDLVGFTSDENLTYFFTATRIPGGDHDAYAIEGTTITEPGSLVIPDADGTLDFEDTVARSLDPNIATIDYIFANNLGAFPVESATVLNGAVMTLEVTNTQGNSAQDDFFVYTVRDNPDAYFGYTDPTWDYVNDLADWTYEGLTEPSTFGFGFPGDENAIGTQLQDDDQDGSSADLLLTVGGLTGDAFDQESLQAWRSPYGLIPFATGQTMRLSFSVRENTPAGRDLVEARVRWGYGSYGRMGGGSTVARPFVNPPDPEGTTYYLVFDNLPIASANNPAAEEDTVNENDITVHFEAIDLFSNYQGAVELESFTHTSVNTAAVIANQTLVESVDNFSEDVTVEVVDYSVGDGQAVQSPTGVFMSTPVENESDHSLVVYGDLAINLINVETIFQPETLPATSGLIYRSEYDVHFSNDVDDPLAALVLRTRTVEGTTPRDTTETQVTSLRENGELNPAYTSDCTYSSYHHFPDDYVVDGVSGADFIYGDGIATSISLRDERANEGGSIDLVGLRVYSVPESIFE